MKQLLYIDLFCGDGGAKRRVNKSPKTYLYKIMFMENQITIQKEKALQAYQQATLEQKALLENIFGKDMFRPKDIKERVKTLEDAMLVLGENHPLVIQYTEIYDNFLENGGDGVKDIVAYLKLRIISAALNEGWKPQYTKKECRWYPWFYLLTEEELMYKSDEWKTDNKLWLVGGAADYGANCGLAFASSNHAWSYSGSNCSARLAVKSEELAEYFGKQFIDIWADFLFA